jgi:hypothetical protein
MQIKSAKYKRHDNSINQALGLYVKVKFYEIQNRNNLMGEFRPQLIVQLDQDRNSIEEGQTIWPGYDYTFRMKKTHMKSVPQKTECHLTDNYSKDSCSNDLAAQSVANEFNCRLPWMYRGDFHYLEPCLDIDISHNATELYIMVQEDPGKFFAHSDPSVYVYPRQRRRMSQQ